MAVKHTLGPWVFVPAGNRPEIVASPVLVARVESLNFVADARLIAAAPELLEALKEARKCLQRCHYVGPEREAIDAAILKATGEA